MTTLDYIAARLSLLLITIAVALWFSQAETTSILATPLGCRPEPSAETAVPRLDLNGNQIDTAVGVYRIDALGHVYESHSPKTDSVRLPPPRG